MRLIFLPEELIVQRLKEIEKILKHEQKNIENPTLGTEDRLSSINKMLDNYFVKEAYNV